MPSEELAGGGGCRKVWQRGMFLINPLPQESLLTFLYTESYMKVLELSRPATPSNGRPRRSVRAPAARERVVCRARACALQRSGSPPGSRREASEGRPCCRGERQGGTSLGAGSQAEEHDQELPAKAEGV